MAATDHPLKRLVSTFITAFASWLLATPVRAAQPLNVELPADILLTDQVFQVTLANGCELILHIPTHMLMKASSSTPASIASKAEQ